MHQDLDFNRASTDEESIPEEIQQIWLSRELIKRLKEVAHNIDERVSQALQDTTPPEKA